MSQIDWTATGTWALAIVAFASFWLQFYFSRKQLRESRKVARDEIGVRLFLQMTERFDSEYMRRQRKTLASQYLSQQSRGPVNEQFYQEINDDVLNFFEDLGSLLRRDLLDERLIYLSFCYYAKGWWSICRSYVRNIRIRDNDSTLFSEFEYFANRMFTLDAEERKVSREQLELDVTQQGRFLDDEQRAAPG